MPQWNMEEIKPLFEALAEAYIWADRYKDNVMKHYLALLLNLAYARFPFVEEEGEETIEDNDDT